MSNHDSIVVVPGCAGFGSKDLSMVEVHIVSVVGKIRAPSEVALHQLLVYYLMGREWSQPELYKPN